MQARLRGSKSLLTLLASPNYFPSLADEIVEPHPDMNIKVATFTESEKSSNSLVVTWDNILALLYVVFSCGFVIFPCGVLGRVGYLIYRFLFFAFILSSILFFSWSRVWCIDQPQ